MWMQLKYVLAIMKMIEKLDAGDIIYQEPVKIDDCDSSSSLHNKFIDIGTDTLLLTLDSILENNFMLHPQDNSLATYAKKINKAAVRIFFFYSRNL